MYYGIFPVLLLSQLAHVRQSVSVWAYPALVLSKNLVPWIVSDRFFPPVVFFSLSLTAHLVFVT